MTPFPVIAVTGLKTEARIVAGPRVVAIAGGGEAAGLEAAVAKKASAIISAGGLAPGLTPGSHAADMESHIAARVAAAHKLPFAAFFGFPLRSALVPAS